MRRMLGLPGFLMWGISSVLCGTDGKYYELVLASNNDRVLLSGPNFVGFVERQNIPPSSRANQLTFVNNRLEINGKYICKDSASRTLRMCSSPKSRNTGFYMVYANGHVLVAQSGEAVMGAADGDNNIDAYHAVVDNKSNLVKEMHEMDILEYDNGEVVSVNRRIATFTSH